MDHQAQLLEREELRVVAVAVLPFFQVKPYQEEVQFQLRSEAAVQVRAAAPILILQAHQEMQLLLLILFVQLVLQLVAAEAVPMEIPEACLEVLAVVVQAVSPLCVVHAEQLAKEMQEAMEKIVLLL